MMRFAHRRQRHVLIALLVCVAVVAAYWVLSASLLQVSVISGWTLGALFVILAAYNLRKKITFLSLGASAAWLQLHVYIGLVTVVLFVVHLGAALPRGGFEWLLAALYAAVAGSGFIGLLMTRWFPPRLNTRGENIIYERIPALRRRLREEAESLVMASVETGNVTTISDLYQNRLLGFFSGPRHLWHHVLGTSRPRHALIGEMSALDRYLSASDRESMGRLVELVCLKDDLDYRYARLSLLKWWLFVHIPLTYALLIVTVVHIVLVYSFSGGTR